MLLIEEYPELTYAHEQIAHELHMAASEEEQRYHCGGCECGGGDDAFLNRFEHPECSICHKMKREWEAQVASENARYRQHSYSMVGPSQRELFGYCEHSMCQAPSIPGHKECYWHHKFDSWGWDCLTCGATPVQVDNRDLCAWCAVPVTTWPLPWCDFKDAHLSQLSVKVA